MLLGTEDIHNSQEHKEYISKSVGDPRNTQFKEPFAHTELRGYCKICFLFEVNLMNNVQNNC